MNEYRYFLVLVALTLTQLLSAQTGRQCNHYASKWLNKKIAYCVERSHPEQPSLNEPVIYFLHGLGGDEDDWIEKNYSKALQTLVSEDPSFPALTFISFETEIDSFFSDFDGSSFGSKAYESWFINEFIPFIENNFGVCKDRSCRGLAGFSMGGFGALKIGLKFPELFSLSAANSPVLPPFSLYEEVSLWKNFFRHQPIGLIKGMILLRDVKRIFPTHELYQENNPIDLVKNFPNSSPFPEIYFDVGSQDNFGFQVGYEIFKNILESNDFPFTSYLEEGGNHSIYLYRNRNLLQFMKRWIKHQSQPL
ncbi:MAG: hypothetical protein EXR74_06735 [Bdellovibrionales bacterium]|nr:hypothetical protein [Bdellovibrionales bacterium]